MPRFGPGQQSRAAPRLSSRQKSALRRAQARRKRAGAQAETRARTTRADVQEAAVDPDVREGAIRSHGRRPTLADLAASRPDVLKRTIAVQKAAKRLAELKVKQAGLFDVGAGLHGMHLIANDFGSAAYHAPIVPLLVGKAVGEDLAASWSKAFLGHGNNDLSHTSALAKALAIGTAKSVTPSEIKKHPGNAALTIFGAGSAALGLGSRAASAGEALRSGEGVGAALKRPGHEGGSLLHRKPPGEIDLPGGVQALEHDNPLLNVLPVVGKRARMARVKKRVEEGPGPLTRHLPRSVRKHVEAQNVVGREVRAREQVQADFANAPVEALRRREKALKPEERTAMRVVAIEGHDAFRQPVETIARQIHTHEEYAIRAEERATKLEQRLEGKQLSKQSRKKLSQRLANLHADAVLNREIAADLGNARPILENPSKEFRQAVGAARKESRRQEKQLIAAERLTKPGAESRRAKMARLYQGAEPVTVRAQKGRAAQVREYPGKPFKVERPRTKAEAEQRVAEIDAANEKIMQGLTSEHPNAAREQLRRNRINGLIRVFEDKGTRRAGTAKALRAGKQRSVADELRAEASHRLSDFLDKNPDHPVARAYMQREAEANYLRELLNSPEDPFATPAAADFGTVTEKGMKPGRRVTLKATAPRKRETKLVGAENLPLQGREGLHNLRKHARAAQPEFKDYLDELGAHAGATVKHSPKALKESRRALQKIERDYGGDASKVKDLVRGRLIVDDVGQLERIVEKAKADGTLVSSKENLTRPNATGYGDLKLYVKVRGHIAEIQVLPREVAAARDNIEGIYKRWRDLPPGSPEAKLLAEKMRIRYAEAFSAWERRRSNASRSTGTPSEAGNSRPTSRGGEVSQASARSVPSSYETGIPSTSYREAPSGGAAESVTSLLSRLELPRKIVRQTVPRGAPRGSFYFPSGERFKYPGRAVSGGPASRRPGEFGYSPPDASRYTMGTLRKFTGKGNAKGVVQKPGEAIATRGASLNRLDSAERFDAAVKKLATKRRKSEFDIEVRAASGISPDFRRRIAAAAEEAASGNKTALVRAENLLREALKPDKDEPVAYLDSRYIKEFASSARGLQTLASINKPFRFGGVYFRPAYVATNRPQNFLMRHLAQGIKTKKPIRGTVREIRRQLGPEVSAKLEALGGQTRTEAYLPSHAVSRGERAITGKIQEWTDRDERFLAVLARAHEKGYRSMDDLRRLVADQAPEKVVNQRIAIGRRADKDMISFRSVTPGERTLSDFLYFYPYLSRGSAWAARFVAEHPAKSAAIEQVGAEAKREGFAELKNAPSWLKGYAKSRLGVSNLNPLNTFSTPAQLVDELVHMRSANQGASFAEQFGTPVVGFASTPLKQLPKALVQSTAPGLAAQRLGLLDFLGKAGAPAKSFPDTGPAEAAGPFLLGGPFPRKPDYAELAKQARQDRRANMSPVERKRIDLHEKRVEYLKAAKKVGLLGKDAQHQPEAMRRAFDLRAARQLAYVKAEHSDGWPEDKDGRERAKFDIDNGLLVRLGVISEAQREQAATWAKDRKHKDIARVRGLIGDKYFGGALLRALTHSLNAHGADVSLN